MNSRRAWILGAWALVVLIAMSALPAAAQTQAEVRAAIIATEGVLVEAEKLVQERRCERGVALVERARELQEKARGATSLGGGGDRLHAALARTHQARTLAEQAVQTCRVETQAVDQVRSLLESTRELAQRAQGQLRARSSADADRLLQAGLDQLEKAESAYRQEQLQLAVSYVTVARKLIDRALNEAPATDALSEPAQVEAELTQTETVLSDLRAVTIAPRRRGLFDQALSNQSRARSALAEGRLVQALEFTLAARRLAADLLRDGAQGADGSRVGRAIEIVENSFVRLEPNLRETGDATVLKLLEQSRESLDLARDQLGEGLFGPAARSARLAGTLLRQAAETAGMR